MKPDKSRSPLNGFVTSSRGSDSVKAFQKFGWIVARQTSSHIIMSKEGEIASLSIPNHKEEAKGTLRSLIRSANLTVDEFVQKLK